MEHRVQRNLVAWKHDFWDPTFFRRNWTSFSLFQHPLHLDLKLTLRLLIWKRHICTRFEHSLWWELSKVSRKIWLLRSERSVSPGTFAVLGRILMTGCQISGHFCSGWQGPTIISYGKPPAFYSHIINAASIDTLLKSFLGMLLCTGDKNM